MKDGLRFVDCDMHVMEPVDIFERYLDPRFRDRVVMPVGADGRPKRGMIIIDDQPTSCDHELQQYRKRPTGNKKKKTESTQPLSGSRMAESGRLNFAVERNYDAEAQLIGMEMEGVDIAVLFPTMGLSLIARDGMDPRLSLALCEAYNNWIYDFCQHSPDQLKFAAMLPLHDVNLACAELVRCVTELGAVGSFVRPNRINVVRIQVPPLRERGDDILLLAQTFLERAAARTGKPVSGLGGLVAERLLEYHWPGNVRELENSMERAVALARFDEITVDDLPRKVRDYQPTAAFTLSDDPDELPPMHVVEERHIRKVLEVVRGNKTLAASVLGFDRRTLYRKLARQLS